MREFTKNLFGLSWAMSLFGARQLSRLLNPQQTLNGAPDAAQAFNSVTDAVVDQFGKNLRQTFEVGDRLQGEIVDAIFRLVPDLAPPGARERPGAGARGGGPAPPAAPPPSAWGEPGWPRPGAASGAGGAGGAGGLIPPRPTAPAGRPAIFNAHTTANEQILITYTRGQGRFSEDKQYIALHNQIYNLDGTENGLHQGVWQALFSSPAQLLSRPAPPTGPMNEPVGPVEGWPVSANTIAKWTHADGSSISSVGPAASHLIHHRGNGPLRRRARAHPIARRHPCPPGLQPVLAAGAVDLPGADPGHFQIRDGQERLGGLCRQLGGDDLLP
jgi:hypothetical protein